MRVKLGLILAVFLLAFGGCGKQKSTNQLIEDLKGKGSSDYKNRLIAVRTLPQRKGDAAQVVPALIEALNIKDASIRLSAIIGLGTFGDKARDAVPALQTAREDPDAQVREAAKVALNRIDPSLAPKDGQ